MSTYEVPILEDKDRALLILLLSSEGFPILRKLMEDEVEKFKVAMINASAANTQEVLAAHAICKAAAQFYAGLMGRLNAEIEVYQHESAMQKVQPDVTEGFLGGE